MKKMGYTLAEALIAIGIVGVVAALMLPLMNKYKPDSDKALFIRTYDSIVEASGLLAEDKTLYPHIETVKKPVGCNDEDDNSDNNCNYWDYSRGPLLNTKKIELIDGTIIDGNTVDRKYCKALAEYMHVETNECSYATPTFKLINDVNFKFQSSDESTPFIRVTVTLPSTQAFYLNVLLNGQVIPEPDMDLNTNKKTFEYLITRSNWKKGAKIEEDLLVAESQKYYKIREYWTNETSSSTARTGKMCKTSDGDIKLPSYCETSN